MKRLRMVRDKGYLFARADGSRPYNPKKDYLYLIPSLSTTGKDSARVFRALRQAQNDEIVVLTIHVVPDYAHPFVTTPPTLSKKYMQYLYDHHYKVIALRDLKNYIDVSKVLQDIPPRLNDRIQNTQHKKKNGGSIGDHQ